MKKRNLSLIAIVASIMLLGAGCGLQATVNTGNSNLTVNVPVNEVIKATNSVTTGDFTTTPTNTNTAAVTTSAVSISGMAFSPATLSVKKGTKVTWTNNDSVGHTVTGGTGGPASATLSNGDTYSFTFNTAGTFNYHCAIHPSMTGTVTVTE